MDLLQTACRAASRHNLRTYDHISVETLEHITRQREESQFAAIHRALMGEEQFRYYLRIAQGVTCNPTH